MQHLATDKGIPSRAELAAMAELLDVPASQVIPEYSVGEVSMRTGLSIDTLRYYEKLGLIDQIARDMSGRRIYSDLDIERIRFVRRLRATGMPVETIAHYVHLRSEGLETAGRRLELLLTHRRELLRQQQELADSLALLDSKIAYYQGITESKQANDPAAHPTTAGPREERHA
ncbi:MerR family transcriptional regulator [Bifidobacterium psychraerophilum]|jgi:DNA-binding transcriptional MerR regulator|uniref:MerR family transcriptional regulator n=1 Tax=Bifidobacterium psychraerophilum TaxID=218140 RepID=UPI0023F80246|nr:MerR family transcriptional regulator [Bifidobacterium psychraerophilum]MCI2181185.1 MerR family transcriptional regulator [Bifidobacterium psychraerophilum]